MEKIFSSEPKRESQVNQELTSGGILTKQLSEVIDRLEDRLSTVLKKQPPLECCEKGEAEALVPLAEIIKSIGNAVRKQTERLDNILNLIEL